MKYSERSVFFQRLRVDAHLRHVGAHLSIATVEQQDMGPPSIRPKTRAARRLVHRMKSILLRQTGIKDRRSHSRGKLTSGVVERPQCKEIIESGIDGFDYGLGTL
jgi:hypothetical protein